MLYPLLTTFLPLLTENHIWYPLLTDYDEQKRKKKKVYQHLHDTTTVLEVLLMRIPVGLYL